MVKQKITIPTWAADDRPREKMIGKGRNALSDAELLAILIETGTGSRSAVDLGRELLRLCNGDLNELGKLKLSQLCMVKGIGPAKAAKLMAAMELGRRRREALTSKRKKIITSFDSYELLRPYCQDLLHEEFYLILLTRSNELIGIRQISVGGIGGTYVDAKMIFKTALELGAAAIVLAHNHPSGNPYPSVTDQELTRKVRHFGSLIEMPVMDHIIISDNNYFSFTDNGLLTR
jgi:DNA repair protein RadC